ncbi:MAG: glycosyltransferase, partial [Deltaproteobacteria bacterium]|nr:glycosyltransferase [Deltaproteobacteria bacterium]
ARRVSHLRDIVFLLVGDGIEKNGLEKRVAGLSLENVLFRPFVPKETYPSLVKDADVGLICLSSKNNTPVVPGKLLGYMAASIPVVAFLNRQSDGHRIIEEAR